MRVAEADTGAAGGRDLAPGQGQTLDLVLGEDHQEAGSHQEVADGDVEGEELDLLDQRRLVPGRHQLEDASSRGPDIEDVRHLPSSCHEVGVSGDGGETLMGTGLDVERGLMERRNCPIQQDVFFNKIQMFVVKIS